MASILVVDDNSENAYLLKMIFGSKGFEVRGAVNGQEALESARRDAPNLIITDILMPVMDGFSLCREWRKDPALAPIPFIFYTATYTDPRDEEFALSLGADLFLVKPKEPEILLRKATELMDSRRGGTASRPSAPSEEIVYLQEYNQALIRKLEAKVQQLEEANRSLAVKDFAISSAISGIVLMDMAGAITYCNGSFAEMWGCPPAEMSGRDVATLAADPREVAVLLDAVKAEGSWIGEIAARRCDGSPFTIQVVMHRVEDRQGASLCVMGSCIDVTEQKRMREELQRAQRMESLSLFAAGIAHDFNNLLTAMFVGLQLMGDELAPSSPLKDQHAIVMSVYARARDLTQRLLAFAKGGSPQRRRLKVADVVRESCALTLSGTPIRFTIAEQGGARCVEADANQLSQVFNNIIINARQAMADQGSLAIRIDGRSIPEGEEAILPPGAYVGVSFSDSGPGIPDEVITRIFEPFYTTKSEGSGLGLATSYAIIKNHGGFIEASSRRGEGACFTVWLPEAREGRTEAPREQAPEESRGVGRILLMDDEETILNLARKILVRAGYEVVAARSGQEAMDLFRQAESVRQPFDLAILDLTVRGGTGGEEAFAALRAIRPGVTALASSGYSDSGTLHQVKQAGFVGLLPKPYLAHELLSSVKASLGKGRS